MSPDSDPNNAALQAQLSLKVSARGYEGEEYLISQSSTAIEYDGNDICLNNFCRVISQ